MNEGFSRNGKTLLSGIDPAGRANRAADAVPVMDKTLYICPSPLYGYGVERLLARIAGFSNSAVLCIEADPELFALSQKHLRAALESYTQLRLTSCRDRKMLCSLLRQEWGPRFFRRLHVVHLNGGWQLFPALYDTLAESLQHEITIDWGNAMTLAKLGRRYILNAVRNLSLIPQSASLEELSFGNDPVLVLGAGPSLDTILNALPCTHEKRHFRIVCVDTCLPALKERGLSPDLAVVLESQHWNLGDFIGLSGWDVPVAMDLSALPRSAGIFANKLFLFFTPWTELRIFERLGNAGMLPTAVLPLGSVGLSAVTIARQLTRGTIIVAGLDFSFTMDSYHARSTPGHLSKLYSKNRFKSIFNTDAVFGKTVLNTASKDGGKVLSNLALRNYRDLFEQEFGADPQLFDIAGTGLPLGITTLSPQAAIDALTCGSITPASLNPIPPRLCEKKFESLSIFVQGEQDRLTLLRNMLTGEAPMDAVALVKLIDECDYLWAHFPDYAGAAELRPCVSDFETGTAKAVSFLKRLRVEIDPFQKLWQCQINNAPSS